VLEDLMGDQSLQKFRGEYEKLHKALQKTHDSEKRLMQKCRELNAEIVANSAKVSTALKLSQDDQATINNLKKVGITPCDAMLARVLAVALCLFVSVSVSVTSRCSVEVVRRIELVFGMEASFQGRLSPP